MGIGYAAAFLGGLASLLSPCSATLLPAFFAYAFGSRTTLIARTGLFYLGMLTTLVPMGLAAGSLGAVLTTHRATMLLVIGLIVVALGVLQAAGGTIPLPGAVRSCRTGDSASPLSVYLLGTAYGVSGVCAGPILGSVLTLAAAGGSVAYGGFLLAVYAAGMVLPVVILALVWERFDLGRSRLLRPRPVRLGPWRTTVVNLVSGGLFVLVGLALIASDRLGWSVLGAGEQADVETWIVQTGRGIPDLVVALLLLGLTLLLSVLWWRRGAHSRRGTGHGD